jgi:uncharacterized ion transporter superfamily protein YfcC
MKARKFPDALLIILLFFLGAALLTYVLPSGSYERTFDDKLGRELVVPGSYTSHPKEYLSAIQLITALPRGIASAAEIIILILMVGGALHIADKTGAFRLGIDAAGKFLRGRKQGAVVVICAVFGAGGIVEGLYEEIVPLVPVVMLIASRFGISPKLAVSASLGSAVVGTAFSPVNPFGAVLAQRIAGVPFLSGAAFGTGALAVAFVVWLLLLLRLAGRDQTPVGSPEQGDESAGSRKVVLVLVTLMVAFAVMAIGLLYMDWGFNEMSGWFFVAGIAMGLMAGMNLNQVVTTYLSGFFELTQPAFLVGFAYSIAQVLKDGLVIDTIVYGLSLPLAHIRPEASAVGMMLSHSALHILLPSYTGQAAMTLPILAPLSDIIGLSREVCVLAFQYGAILMDMVIPTSGALMAVLTLSKIRYDEWFGFVAKPLLIMYAFAAAALIVAGLIGI